MSHAEQWQSLAVRIRGLARVFELLAMSRKEEPYGVAKELREQCKDIVGAIRAYYKAFQSVLPDAARGCVERFLSGKASELIDARAFGDRELIAGSLIMFLSAFETEMSFVMSDQQERIRVRSERAFLHLQWLLAVDPELREWWEVAYDRRGEVECEQRGGVHLLWHGIYAFKVHTPHARTDLVFNEPVEVGAGRAVEGFVLTEWKKGTPENALEMFGLLRTQMEAYQRGPLGGTELTGYRYGIVVSKQQLPRTSIPEEPVIDGVRFRYVNIAIDPRSPSVEGRFQASADRQAKRRGARSISKS